MNNWTALKGMGQSVEGQVSPTQRNLETIVIFLRVPKSKRSPDVIWDRTKDKSNRPASDQFLDAD